MFRAFACGETRRQPVRALSEGGRELPDVAPDPPGAPARTVDVLLVVPEACEACGGKWAHEIAVDKGVKCRMLEARLRCSGCGDSYTISFCLPELR